MFVNGRFSRVISLLGLTALLVLSTCVAASAVQVGSAVDTELTGALGTFQLHATVDLTNSVYTYSYQLTFGTAGSSNVTHLFTVGNLDNVNYFGATNSGAAFEFANPEWVADDLAIEWYDGELATGHSATFSYKSYSAPDWVAQVNVTTANLASVASGRTIGMSSMVPEPSAFAALAMALAGAVPFLRRRR